MLAADKLDATLAADESPADGTELVSVAIEDTLVVVEVLVDEAVLLVIIELVVVEAGATAELVLDCKELIGPGAGKIVEFAGIVTLVMALTNKVFKPLRYPATSSLYSIRPAFWSLGMPNQYLVQLQVREAYLVQKSTYI